jgi:small-conductance mechanosensitive channel
VALVSTKVINWTLMEAYRRIHIPFKVAYGTDIDAVTQAVLEAADRVPHTLKTKKPGVWLIRFGDSSLDYELVVWIMPAAVKRPGAVHADYMREIHIALRRYAIEIPLPQRDLHLRSGFWELVQAGPGADSGGSSEPEAGRKLAHG